MRKIQIPPGGLFLDDIEKAFEEKTPFPFALLIEKRECMLSITKLSHIGNIANEQKSPCFVVIDCKPVGPIDEMPETLFILIDAQKVYPENRFLVISANWQEGSFAQLFSKKENKPPNE